MKFFYYFSLELYFKMPVSFLLFLNHLVFVTLYMQVYSTVKCQINGSLVKVYFSKGVGSKCWVLTFTLIFFGLLPERLCWGPCWWWFTRNIWPKARVACIFCYGWTHLCQTHCSGAVSNLKFLLFMLLCKVLTTQLLTCNLV